MILVYTLHHIVEHDILTFTYGLFPYGYESSINNYKKFINLILLFYLNCIIPINLLNLFHKNNI